MVDFNDLEDLFKKAKKVGGVIKDLSGVYSSAQTAFSVINKIYEWLDPKHPRAWAEILDTNGQLQGGYVGELDGASEDGVRDAAAQVMAAVRLVVASFGGDLNAIHFNDGIKSFMVAAADKTSYLVKNMDWWTGPVFDESRLQDRTLVYNAGQVDALDLGKMALIVLANIDLAGAGVPADMVQRFDANKDVAFQSADPLASIVAATIAPAGAAEALQHEATFGAEANYIHDSPGGTYVQAGGGNDTVESGTGPDIIDLGDGDDTVVLTGFASARTVSITGGTGRDTLSEDGGTSSLTANLASGTAAIGAASATLVEIENLVGSAVADLLTGDAGNNGLRGGAGDDTVSGGAGADTIYGNTGSDVVAGNQDADLIFGGQNADRLFGGQGSDQLFGNLGDDAMAGNLANDLISGGQGSDTLYGGQGDDTLVGGLGNDLLFGNMGADRFVFGQNSGNDRVAGFSQAEGDRLDLQGQTYTTGSAQDGSAVLTLSGGGTVTLTGIEASAVNGAFFS